MIGFGDQERRGMRDDPRFLASTEAGIKGQGKQGRRQAGPHHTGRLHRWPRLPLAKLIIGKHLSSQKMRENPLKSKKNVCYKAHWLGLFLKIGVIAKPVPKVLGLKRICLFLS